MPLSSYYLAYGRHVARLRRRRRRRAYAPTRNAASHDNHEKINSWVSFSLLYGYGAPLGDSSGRRSSAIIFVGYLYNCVLEEEGLQISLLFNLGLQIPYSPELFRGWFKCRPRSFPQHSITHSCDQELRLAGKVFDWQLFQHAFSYKRSERTSGWKCNKTWTRWRGCFPYKENGS